MKKNEKKVKTLNLYYLNNEDDSKKKKKSTKKKNVKSNKKIVEKKNIQKRKKKTSNLPKRRTVNKFEDEIIIGVKPKKKSKKLLKDKKNDKKKVKDRKDKKETLIDKVKEEVEEVLPKEERRYYSYEEIMSKYITKPEKEEKIVKTISIDAKPENKESNKSDVKVKVKAHKKPFTSKQDLIKGTVEIKAKKKSKKAKKQQEHRRVKTEEDIKREEKARKRRKIIIKLTQELFILGSMIAAIILIMYSPIFNIEEIKIEGNSKISTEDILQLSQIQISNNIYKLSKNDIKDNIKQNAYIDTVTIKRKLPSVIEVKVSERQSSYMIEIGGGYSYINNQGYILEISTEKNDKIILRGYETPQEEIKTGNRLCINDLQKLDDILKIVESANGNDIGNLITDIDISSVTNYILNFESEKKKAYIGDITNLTTKMLFVKSMLQREYGKEGEFFVNMDLNTRDAYFREKI